MKNKAMTRIEPGIWKDSSVKDTPYFVLVSRRLPGANGKRPSRQGWVQNLREARQKKEEFQIELRILEERKARLTVATFEPEFMEFLERDLTKETFYRQKGIWRDQVFRRLGEKYLDDITLPCLEAFLEDTCNGKSSQTRRHMVMYLRKLFKRAMLVGYIQSNPASLLKTPKRSKKFPAILREDEVTKLLSFLETHQPILFVHVGLAVHTGMRASELRALTWGDVKESDCLITVTKQLMPDGTIKDLTKTGQDRVVPINQELRKILDSLKDFTFTGNESLLLPYWREFWSGEQAKYVRMACRLAGVPEIRFHDLRATFVTCLFCQGVPVHQVMLMTGHQSLRSVEIYIRTAGRKVVGATDGLSFLSGDRKSSTVEPDDSQNQSSNLSNGKKLRLMK